MQRVRFASKTVATCADATLRVSDTPSSLAVPQQSTVVATRRPLNQSIRTLALGRPPYTTYCSFYIDRWPELRKGLYMAEARWNVGASQTDGRLQTGNSH